MSCLTAKNDAFDLLSSEENFETDIDTVPVGIKGQHVKNSPTMPSSGTSDKLHG